MQFISVVINHWRSNNYHLHVVATDLHTGYQVKFLVRHVQPCHLPPSVPGSYLARFPCWTLILVVTNSLLPPEILWGLFTRQLPEVGSHERCEQGYQLWHRYYISMAMVIPLLTLRQCVSLIHRETTVPRSHQPLIQQLTIVARLDVSHIAIHVI